MSVKPIVRLTYSLRPDTFNIPLPGGAIGSTSDSGSGCSWFDSMPGSFFNDLRLTMLKWTWEPFFPRSRGPFGRPPERDRNATQSVKGTGRILQEKPAVDPLEIGLQGFEPWTSCTRNKRATKLRYSPRLKGGYSLQFGSNSRNCLNVVEPVNSKPFLWENLVVRASKASSPHKFRGYWDFSPEL